MNIQNIQTLDHHHIAQTYARFHTTLIHGKGCEAWDTEGKRYLDFTSGIGTNSLGWCDDTWLTAITQQAATLQHTSNLFYTQPAAELAHTLTQRSGMDKVFFCNSGAEANECAIKTARKYSQDRYGNGRSTIITLNNSFHGRTITTLAANGQDQFHQHFQPFTEGFIHTPANDIIALQQIMTRTDVCALMIEIIQGEGGLNVLDNEYLAQAQSLCQKHDILLIIDEVQTGIGRTGTLLASQLFHLTPDVITLAKGLGGGLPIGAVLFNSKCSDTLGKGDHGSTFGGNPVCCAAANAVLNRLDETFLAEVRRKSKKLHQALASLPHIQQISGLGLMLGITFAEHIAATDIVQHAMQQGLLTLTAKTKMRLLPPLIISDDQIDEGVSILGNILEKIA